MSLLTALEKKLQQLAYSTVFEMVLVLEAGGVKTLDMALEVLCDHFVTDNRFKRIRDTMFPVVLEEFLKFLKNHEKVPDVSLTVPSQVPCQVPCQVHYTCVSHDITKCIYSRGGYGRNQNLPENFKRR